MANRAEVRSFIDKLRPMLERAQADGILARVKLDVRDRFEESISEEDEAQRVRSLNVFTEELDAFCTDFRLAVVTVQQQVERHKRRWGRGFLCGLLFGVVTLIVGVALAMSAQGSGGSSTFAGFVIVMGAPIAFFVGLFSLGLHS